MNKSTIPPCQTNYRRTAVIGASMAALILFGGAAHAGLVSLPTTPSGLGGTTVTDGDWLATLGAYFKQGFSILGLVIAAVAFFTAAFGTISKYREYTAGRLEVGELKQYIIVAVVVMVFVVLMVTLALQNVA